MRALAALPLTVALVSGSIGLAACGADAGEDSESEANAEHEVVAAVDSLHRSDDAPSYCDQLTEAGRRYVMRAGDGDAESCEQVFEGEAFPANARVPRVDPVGVEDDFAVAVVRAGGEYDESFVYTLKREDGRWLIDCPCVVPTPDQLVANESESAEAQEYINSPAGLTAADQEDTDGKFDPVIAVGDVAFAYQSQAGFAPTLLVNDGNGWRVLPTSLGAP
jgi:hypothetical protein